MLTVRELVKDNATDINFTWLAGLQATDQALTNHPGRASADLVGHLNLIHPSRIQVLGAEELAYYTNFNASRRLHLLEELRAGGVPAILVAEDLQAPEGLRDFCETHDIPLLSTHIDAAQLIDLLRIYLGKRLAPKTLMHGVFLDVLGVGVLITGESGLGKSELALELISRGHGLVADDAVELSRIAPSIVEGHCPQLLQNLLEVRGLGLLDIRTIFGETS
ncbi:MAG: HPr kinase/phosphorylase, partial [Alcaligenaceae bacterium]|nr:HPr kinase/phosphorylase [Alcaligenaceae bacterium]